MTKYHINKHGVPARCHAKENNCPLGNESEHFNSHAAAQNRADQLAESEHGLLPNILSDNNNNLGLSKEWYDRISSYTNFESLLNNHATEMIEDELIDSNGDLYGKSMNIWKDVHYKYSLGSLSKLSEQEAVDIIRNKVDSSAISGWFREYDSDYKPRIENAIMTDPEVRNASMSIAHRVYQESSGVNLSYEEFIESEIEVYRGGNFDFVPNDVFISYSFDKEVASKFANGGPVVSKKVKIAETLGSLQTTGEAELMVRNRLDYE